MKRLEAVCSLIERCGVLADVGCDHGFVSKYVSDNKLADRIITSDISEACLSKAKTLLAGRAEVEFECCDGLPSTSVDTVVIAGMGGTTILDIISKKLTGYTLILQPQDHQKEIRQFLTANGYCFVKDFVVKERGRYYDIMLCKVGQQSLSELQAVFGVFYEEGDSVLQERLEKEYNKLCGFNDGGKNDAKKAQLKEVLTCTKYRK